jgi:hypothetical protein
MKLAIVTGIEDVNKLREAVKEEYESWQKWYTGQYFRRDFWVMLNMAKLDTLK